MSSFIVLCTVIFIDVSITKLIILPHSNYQANFLELFVVLSLLFATSTAVVLFAIRKFISRNSRLFDSQIVRLNKCILLIYAIVIFLLIMLNSNILIENKYYLLLPIFITYLSYLTGLLFSGLLIIKYLKWYNREKEFTLLGYLITVGALFAFVLFSLSYFTNITSQDFDVVVLPKDIGSVIAFRNTFSNLFELYFNTSYIVCIISISIITFLVLRGYIKINRPLYFVLFSLPVIYVLVKYIPPVLNIITSIMINNPSFYGTLYTLFFSGTGPLTGFLFFLPMWFFSSKLKITEIKNFLWIASFGMLLFFTSNQEAPLQNKLFPPFGVVASAVTGLSLYLIFLGLISTVFYLTNVTSYKILVSKRLREDKFFRSITRSYFEEKLNHVINRAIENKLFPVEKRDELLKDEINLYVKEVKEMLLEKKDIGEKKP